MNNLKCILIIASYAALNGCSAGAPQEPAPGEAISPAAHDTQSITLPPGYTFANVAPVRKTQAEFMAALAERVRPEVQKQFDEADQAKLAKLQAAGSTP
jgi:hypothetical protein